jgi:hypothetical protein
VTTEQLPRENEAVGDGNSVPRQPFDHVALVAQVHGTVERAFFAIDHDTGAVGVVGHQQAQCARLEGFPSLNERPQDPAHQLVELLQPEALGDQVAQERLRDLEPRRPRVAFRLGLEHAAIEHPPQDPFQHGLVAVEEADPDQLLDAARDHLEDVDVLVDADSLGEQRLVQHGDAHGQSPAPATVDAQRPQHEPQPARHPQQRVARDVLEVLLREHALEEHVGQRLDPEAEPRRLELLLAIAPVHARDADGDVPLVIDVLDALRPLLADDDHLELLQHVEQDLQRPLVPPVGQRLLQLAEPIGVDAVKGAQALEQVVVIQLVLVADELAKSKQQLRLLASERRPGQLLQAALDLGHLEGEQGVQVV